jgi:hypothetical protein
MNAYYSVLNRFTVYDLESFYPFIKVLQEILKKEYDGFLKTTPKEMEVNLSLFIYDELRKESLLKHALQFFYNAANLRLSGSYPNARTLPESAKVLPAVVALNSLYEAIHSGKHVDDVLARLFAKHYLRDIMDYVEAHQPEPEPAPESEKTQTSNNDVYGFGALEGGRKKTRRRARKMRKTRRR